ncbi:ARSB, partial [Symbiodinium microadriaticum]
MLASTGKWHLGLTPESKPIKRGFDETLGFDIIARYLPFGAASASCKFPDFFDRYLWANTRYEVSKDNGPFFAPRGYLTDYLAEEAARAIHVNKANPFFMYMAFTSMHTPLEALQSDYDAVEALETVYGYEKGAPRMTHCQKVYGAMLLGLDRAVGTILSAVDAAGISDDTIVIFTNDNGAPLIFPHMNAPYRGGKANLFEGGIRVDAIVSHLDLFPTIMEVAGAGSPGTEPIDGSSLVPLMKAAASRNRVAASTGNPMVDESRDGMATDDNKESTAESGHEALFWRSGHYMALRHGDWKLQVAARPDKKWLYNMKEDPREMINLAENNAYESKLIEMLSLLESENSKHSEPLWPALSETPLLIDKLFHDHY